MDVDFSFWTSAAKSSKTRKLKPNPRLLMRFPKHNLTKKKNKTETIHFITFVFTCKRLTLEIRNEP